VVTVKAIYANLAAGIPVKIRDLMVSPLVVPSTLNALQLLDTFKRAGRHLAMVVDEFGTVTGLATMHDVLEAIVGEFPSPGERLRPAARRRDDGSWLVDAMLPIEEFAASVKDFPLDPAGTSEYETFAGFVVSRLGHVPQEGECFACGAYTVEVIDMDGHRVDKVLLLPSKPPA
jgi:putative hemolysin